MDAKQIETISFTFFTPKNTCTTSPLLRQPSSEKYSSGRGMMETHLLGIFTNNTEYEIFCLVEENLQNVFCSSPAASFLM